MKRITYKDSGPKFLFSTTGELKLLRTGSDTFEGQKNASDYLVPRLCTVDSVELKSSPLTAHRITKADLLQFHHLPKGPGGRPEAVFGFNGANGPVERSGQQTPLTEGHVLFNLEIFYNDIAAALEYGNFAIRVRGKRLVQALSNFHQAALAGDIALASYKSEGAQGVAFVNLTLLTPDEHQKLDKNPHDFLWNTFFHVN
jgi:hypothetical protein